ncbi:MAG: alpha/beta hydrolase [Sphingopyxis sp.]|nr:alpha/beta hydrolase [Sphingopyxis sp.]
MPLHPDAAAFLQAMADIAQPPEATVQEFRDAAAKLVRTDPPLDIGKVEDVAIAGGDGQPLTLRIYTPEGEGPFAAAVWTRGGSFTRTTLDQMDPLRRATAKIVGCVVVAVDQRLSPEASYPDPLNDGDAALQWTFAHAAELNVDPGRIGIAGESSGGNLAASLAVRSHRRGSPKLAFQLLFAPLVDASLSSPSIEEFADGYVLTKRQLVWAYDQYAPGVDRQNPEISPLLAGDFTDLPPAVVITIENDPVRDEGELYAQRLAAAGVKVKQQRIEGMVHHFPGPQAMPVFFGLCRELLAEID